MTDISIVISVLIGLWLVFIGVLAALAAKDAWSWGQLDSAVILGLLSATFGALLLLVIVMVQRGFS